MLVSLNDGTNQKKKSNYKINIDLFSMFHNFNEYYSILVLLYNFELIIRKNGIYV